MTSSKRVTRERESGQDRGVWLINGVEYVPATTVAGWMPPAPDTAPLDVERLAEALHRAVVTGYGESACGGAGGMDDPLVFHLGEARAIAREYAALSDTEAKP